MQRLLLLEFAKYASFQVLGMLGLSCYILADTFFVSQGLGTQGLAALNLAIPAYSLVNGVGLMLGMGGATKYAVYKSLSDRREQQVLFPNTLYLTALAACVFVLTGLFLSDPLAALLGADGTVFDQTRSYLQVILLFAPAFLTNNVVLCFVRNDGDPRLCMLAMLGGSLSNIVLDYLFLFPLRMGMHGAAIATGLAPLISLLILARHWRHKSNQLHLTKAKPELRLVRPILSLGVPSLVLEVSSGIVMIVCNAVLLRLEGNVGIAAYGVIANLSLVAAAVFTGVAQGMQPLVSRAHGRRDTAQEKQLLRSALWTIAGLSCGIYLLLYWNADPIVQLFNRENEPHMQVIAAAGLKLYFTSALFMGGNIILSVYFTATERAVPAQLISLGRGLFVIVPLVWLFSALGGLTGVWLAFPAAECLVALLGAGLYYARVSKRR